MTLIFGLALIAAFVGVLVALQERRDGVPMPALAKALGVPSRSVLAVERHDRSFEVKFVPGGKSSPSRLWVTAKADEASEAAGGGAYRETGRGRVAVRPAMVLRQRTGADRLGVRLGLNRAVRTGDEAFDEAVYIETAAPEEDVRRTLASDVVRQAVRALLAQEGAQRVQLDVTGLSVVKAVERTPDVGAFDGAAEQLAVMAAEVPLFGAGSAAGMPARFNPVQGVVAGVGLLMLAVQVGWSPPIDQAGALAFGLGGGLAVAVAVVLAGVAAWRGQSDGLRRVAAVAVAGLLAGPVSGYAAVCWANQQLDTSPAVDHATKVTDKWVAERRGARSRIEVASWRPGEPGVVVAVTPALVGRVMRGDTVVVVSHAGRLGWEWVDGCRLP